VSIFDSLEIKNIFNRKIYVSIIIEPMPNPEDQGFVYARASDLIRIMRTPADRANLAKELSNLIYIILRPVYAK